MCTMSAQRLRRWSDIVQMLYQCLVFAGFAHLTGVYCAVCSSVGVCDGIGVVISVILSC